MAEGSIFRVFVFALRLVRRAKKMRVFAVLSLLPVLLAVILRLNAVASPGRGLDGLAVFGNIIVAFGLQFLVLILALFYGTSVVSEEIEGKTLTYLTIRPLPKKAVILGKYAASALVLLVLVLGSTLASFFILNLGRLDYGPAWSFLGKSLAALALGVLGYTAFFTFIGTFLKKSVLFGFFFSFGWENIVQYFPGSTQKLTLMHYLKSILPGVGETSPSVLQFLMFRLDPSPAPLAVAVLLGLTAVFLALACRVFSRKEYLFEE
ncbi:MAG: ABC transporter permease [Candidatus Aminicenantes bacterium]|nr:ABC transporter permease [Candidatus Aminicenantes bacterium]